MQRYATSGIREQRVPGLRTARRAGGRQVYIR